MRSSSPPPPPFQYHLSIKRQSEVESASSAHCWKTFAHCDPAGASVTIFSSAFTTEGSLLIFFRHSATGVAASAVPARSRVETTTISRSIAGHLRRLVDAAGVEHALRSEPTAGSSLRDGIHQAYRRIRVLRIHDLLKELRIECAVDFGAGVLRGVREDRKQRLSLGLLDQLFEESLRLVEIGGRRTCVVRGEREHSLVVVEFA